MHGINGDHRAGQYKRAEQSLDGRDFIGFFVTVEMRQHQSRVGSKGAEYVRGAAVEKVVKASPQCLAIDRHMTLTFAVRRVVQHGGMAAERRFDRGWIKLSQDACAAMKVASKGVTWNRVAGIPYAAIRRRFASACGISDSPSPHSQRRER